MKKIEKSQLKEEQSQLKQEDVQKNEQEPPIFINETGSMINSKALHAGQGMYIQAKT